MFCWLCDIILNRETRKWLTLEVIKSCYVGCFEFYNCKNKPEDHSFLCFILHMWDGLFQFISNKQITKGGYQGCVYWDGKKDLSNKSFPCKHTMPIQISHLLSNPALLAFIITGYTCICSLHSWNIWGKETFELQLKATCINNLTDYVKTFLLLL